MGGWLHFIYYSCPPAGGREPGSCMNHMHRVVLTQVSHAGTVILLLCTGI